jgi:acyl carrier protein
MTVKELLAEIERVVNDALEARGLPRVVVDEETRLVGGGLGIDSLDLAAVVGHLQTVTGEDPFAEGFVDFNAAGELARLFERRPDVGPR